MDVYKIGVSMVLTNGVSPVLAIIAKNMLGVQGSINSITKGFAAWKPALALRKVPANPLDMGCFLNYTGTCRPGAA